MSSAVLSTTRPACCPAEEPGIHQIDASFRAHGGGMTRGRFAAKASRKTRNFKGGTPTVSHEDQRSLHEYTENEKK